MQWDKRVSVVVKVTLKPRDSLFQSVVSGSGAERPNRQNGMNGNNGRNGFSAPAGNGGANTVIYDPSAQPYPGAILLSSRNGPAPVLSKKSSAHFGKGAVAFRSA